ncbi:4Fe-4S binding protein [Micromonospora sp. NPDC005189]|uniref:4Fe-4S binding protein n=1 Tax=unclassified Micromonospora TaxID=2617518 RepID=UPI0033B4F226
MGAAPQSADLSVDLCGVRLDGPLLLGSGGLGESADTLADFQRTSCAAVVTRTLRTVVLPGRERFPSPHLSAGPRRNWLLNCEWGNLRPLRYWTDTGLPEAAARGPVIASISGRSLEDCERTCRAIAGSPIALVEINFSCSHAGQAFGRVSDDADHVARVVTAAKRVSPAPVIAKLGWSPVLAEVAAAAARAGADAISVTNSIGPGLDIDVDTGRPKLGIAGGFGGMSGPAIFPIALECVRQVVDAVPVPVIGVGGISSADDAIKMIMVGATCVQVYTAATFRGPAVFDAITNSLRHHLRKHGHQTVAAIRGLATPHLREPTNTHIRVPVVDTARCHPCGACQRVCPADAIDMTSRAEIRPDACTGCGLCVDVCPPYFNALSLPQGTSNRNG